jgi:ABC-2 type transport system permease protein
MWSVFLHTLNNNRGAVLGWGISLGLLGGYLVNFYETFGGMEEELSVLIQSYPKDLFAFFGDFDQIFTPAGFLNTEFFSYMPLILGIYAVLAGSGLLVSDEENGVLDLVLSYPLSRSSYYWGRLVALMISVIFILLIAWFGFVVVIPSTPLGINAVEMARPFLALFWVVILFGSLSVFLSMLLPSRRTTAMVSGLLLVASFFITGLSALDERIDKFARFSPLNYYQGGDALNGIKWEWILGLAGFSLLFILLAWLVFWRRDIRVGGEGGWKIPFFTAHRSRTIAE